jgi:hypothetical protein
MNMFGHDDVADQGKPVAEAHFFKNLDRQISDSNGAEQGPALIATKGDEMEVATTGNARLRFFGIGAKNGPPFANCAKGRPPRMAMFYHFTVIFDSGYPSCEHRKSKTKHTPPAKALRTGPDTWGGRGALTGTGLTTNPSGGGCESGGGC